MKKGIVIVTVLLLSIALVFSGCVEENGGDENDINEVKQASSLKYSWSFTHPDEMDWEWSYSVKNIGTDQLKFRIEMNEEDGTNSGFIFNQELQKGWTFDGEDWEEIPEEYFSIWFDNYATEFSNHLTDYLYDWDGEPIEYTHPTEGWTWRFHGIEIDPS